MEDFFSRTFLENTYEDYAWFIGWLLVGFIFQKSIAHFIVKILSNLFYKYSKDIPIERFYKELERPLRFFQLLVFIYLAFSHLNWPESWDLGPADEFGLKMFVRKTHSLFFGFSLTYVFVNIADCFGLILLEKAAKTESKQDDQLIPFLIEFIKIMLWVIGGLIVLSSVFNINMGSLVAGLGVGGLAIALAAKESVENLFGSFTIFFDKPFVVGDLVKVGDIVGEVEKVGFRSTRIRTLEKSYVTLPNKRMIDAELDNLSLRTFRRVNFNVGLTYSTPPETIKKIVKEIQNYIDEHPHTNQDGKVRFMEFGDSSLNVMVLYYIDTMDWGMFLDIKEEINYKIMDIVSKNGSDFAFPTQSIYLENYKPN